METLRTALHRFDKSPPTIHGTFELLSQDEGMVVRDEVWVAWPAVRVKQRWKGSSRPVVIATSDGKRFGYRDPGSGEAGISRGLGGAFMPYPMLQYFGLRQDACPAPDILRTESMMGRRVIHIGCDESNGWDQWIDLRTGLLLREAVRRQEFSHQPYWGGYVQLEFGPRLDEGLFDPHSVRSAQPAAFLAALSVACCLPHGRSCTSLPGRRPRFREQSRTRNPAEAWLSD
jgi:hypothetical protein